jgi:hypothetical protein
MESLNDASPLVEKAIDGAAIVVGCIGFPVRGFLKRILKSGQTPLEKVVENLESACLYEHEQINNRLVGHDDKILEFEKRLQSVEARDAYFASVVHGMRTSDPAKHSRLGILTVRSIYVGKLNPENLDNLMSATVMLQERDIALLQKIYEYEINTLRRTKRGNRDSTNLFGDLQSDWNELLKARVLDDTTQLVYRSSLGRLESLGFIQQFAISDAGFGHERYVLLEDGVVFVERIKEISITSVDEWK